MRSIKSGIAAVAAALGVFSFSFSGAALAEPITINPPVGPSVTFPQGAISFADAVVEYVPGTGGVTAPYQGSGNALGQPDYTGANGCLDQASCTFLSLGNGGSITLRFTDNLLTGSSTNGEADGILDLWIFEIGPAVEAMNVFISKNGQDWSGVGSVGGSTSGVDIDAFGFSQSDSFGWVRLVDIFDASFSNGDTAGADIDAIGAITTIRASIVPDAQVPLPGSLALMGLGLLGIVAGRRFAASRSGRAS